MMAVAAQETEPQRVNRELLELLGELRIFAFLLAVPFQARFADATDFRRVVYFATLALSALAVAMTWVMILISDVLFGSAAAVLVGAMSAGVFAFFWWLLPTTMSGER